MKLLLKRNVKDNIEHCKIQTLCYYLKTKNIDISEHIIFLLGLDEFLQFGLENYKQQLLWFMITYNEYCEKKIMNYFGIKESPVPTSSIDEIKKYVDEGRDVGVYFDFNVRKVHKDKVISVSNTPVINMGRFMFNSFGIIENYDDEYFYLNVVDLDGKPIRLNFKAYEENKLYEHTVFLEIDESIHKNEDSLYPVILDDLKRACDIYLTEVSKYQYDEESKKYGVSGKSSFAALNEEVKALINKFTDSEDERYLKILAYRLNIMRLYQDKGSKTAFRSEIGNSLIYLGKYNPLLKESGEEFIALGKHWREFVRILYQVNMPYFYRNPKKYYEKFYSIICNLASAEEAAVSRLREVLHGE
ncbi:MAG: hypothetical protein GXX10_01640 [Clostridiaceae bacterium]|nr:hypothetical protein [Clostridiaceae bacterium]